MSVLRRSTRTKRALTPYSKMEIKEEKIMLHGKLFFLKHGSKDLDLDAFDLETYFYGRMETQMDIHWIWQLRLNILLNYLKLQQNLQESIYYKFLLVYIG